MCENQNRRVKHHDERGMALLLSLMAVLVIAAAAALIMVNVSNSSKNTNFAVNDTLLEEACKAGIDIGIERVWHEYVIGNGNTTGNVASYRTFVNVIVKNNETLNSVTKDYNGDGTVDSNPAATLIASNAAVTLQSGAKVTGLQVSRCDDIGGVRLTFTATAQLGASTKSVTQAVRVGGSPFAGFEFAVLANNINCILCHADFKNNDMYKLSNGAMVPKTNAEQAFNGTDRVKVAALESLLIRTNEADSRTSGSLYSRGNVYTSSGTLLNAAGIAAAFTSGGFGAYAFSNTNGKITQDATSGNMSKCALANATVSGGCPSQFANLYLNYPSNTDQMTDGPLPQSFPAPFPDDNGNRKVDTTEFQKVMNLANGKITNGIAYGVASGQTYSGTDLPAASSSGTMQQLASGKYSGNLILVGSSAAPITIDKQVAVDGDVIIKGPIKGYGQLMVSGNVYVVGDVTYADAAGQFGVASDGTANAFALEAGGNIMMGDYLTVRAKNNYVTTKTGTSTYTDTADSGVWEGQFVRVDQNTGYNVTMDSADLNPSGVAAVAAQKTGTGYFDSGTVDPGVIPTGAGTVTSTTTYTVGTGSSKQTHTLKTEPESQSSFTTSELMLFNRMEHQKWAPPGNPDYNASTYIAGYTPRYYQLRDTAQVLEYRVTSSTDSNLVEHVVDYASPGVTPLVATTSSSYYQGAGAAVLSLAPKGGWMSETTLRKIWYNDEAARRASPTYVKTNVSCSPFRFDGLLYTNNAIFGVMRSNGRHGSQTYGKLWVRGAIVCADLGLLSTDNAHTSSSDSYYGGVEVYYDKRVKAFLNVVDPTKVQFTRLAYQPRAVGSGI